MSTTKPDLYVCVDRTPPPQREGDRMAAFRDLLWNPGDVIHIRFADGTSGQRTIVQSVAKQWLKYANLHFSFNGPAQADIRISFKGVGSWSYIGTSCRRIPKTEPTMNFGWLTETLPAEQANRVILHEFGHALGCIHEHQNPARGILWNRPAVYDYYSGPPNFWNRDQIDRNIIQQYNRDHLEFTPTDGRSIMMYPVDSRLTLDGFHVEPNNEISTTDAAFMTALYSPGRR